MNFPKLSKMPGENELRTLRNGLYVCGEMYVAVLHDKKMSIAIFFNNFGRITGGYVLY